MYNEYALGNWVDIVGQQRGGGGGGGGGGRGPGGGRGQRHQQRGFYGGGYGYPYPYPAYDPYAMYGGGGGGGGTDPAILALLQQLVMAQQQQQAPGGFPGGPAPGGMAPPAPPAPGGAPTPTTTGQWMDIVGQGLGGPVPAAMPFAPRAALVDAAPATFAARDILPLSTGVPILPTQSAQITGRPQARAFRGDRFMVSNAGTAGGAADWIINDIKIGNRSQFVQSGDVPGDLFAVNAIDTFVRFETAQTAMDIVIVVTYIGLNESGAPFFAALVGTAAI